MKHTFSFLLIITLVISCKKQDSVGYIEVFKNERISTSQNSKLLDSLTTNNLVTSHPSITIDSIKYYIVEGDMLLNDYEYMQYQISEVYKIDSAQLESKLIIRIDINKNIIKWPENYVIKYCITRNSFKTKEQYEIVKKNMQQATEDWEKTCNVKFQYVGNKDNNHIITPTDDLTFVVLGFDVNRKFIASAFFPNDPITKRRLLIDPSYFDTNYNKTGVFRHEIGHILGFAHEQISIDAPKPCQGESRSSTTPVTKYDPKSVMHYFCEGMGTIDLLISKIDEEGSQKIYGAPIF